MSDKINADEFADAPSSAEPQADGDVTAPDAVATPKDAVPSDPAGEVLYDGGAFGIVVRGQRPAHDVLVNAMYEALKTLRGE